MFVESEHRDRSVREVCRRLEFSLSNPHKKGGHVGVLRLPSLAKKRWTDPKLRKYQATETFSLKKEEM